MRWIAAALFTLLVLSACAEGADDAAVTTTLPAVDVGPSTTSTSPVETTTTTQATTTTAQATTTTIEGALIRVVVEAGEVTVRGSTSVPAGERVTIRVRADIDDEVHVHTYDLAAEVGPGSAAEISFVADVPGVHEVELEQSGTKLLDLEVGG
jgi:hypothetical protein